MVDAEAAYRAWLRERGLALETAAFDDLLGAMLDWYQEVRFEDAAPLAQDGDMLLYQWGPYERVDAFECGLTRQLIDEADPGDEGTHQLSVTFRFALDDGVRALGSGPIWCGDPSTLEDFRATVSAHPATVLIFAMRAAGY